MILFNSATFSVKQLTFERQYQYLFENLNFDLRSGEILQVCGDNGAGKSTLLRILAGLIEPQAGKILWEEKSIFAERDNYLEQIQYLGHQNGIKNHLTVRENILFQLTLANKVVDKSHLDLLLTRMGLNRYVDKKAALLSAGQLRRLALLRLFIKPAPLWILDEPLNSLDTKGQTLLMEYLKNHLTQNGMAIIATHHPLPFSDVKTLKLAGAND